MVDIEAIREQAGEHSRSCQFYTHEECTCLKAFASTVIQLCDEIERLREERSEARGVARAAANITMHPYELEGFFATWTAQAKAEAEKAGGS